jgi:putative endonuclease
MYRVYVIRNSQGRFYIGFSEDSVKRLADHNSGISQWTRGRGPWDLVWTSIEMTRTEAKRLENLLKRQKGGKGFYSLTGLVRGS